MNLKTNYLRFGGIFDVDNRQKEIESLNEKMAQPGFWDRPQEAQETVERLKILKKQVDPFIHCQQARQDLEELLSMVDEKQEESFRELEIETVKLSKAVEDLEFQRLLSDPLDANNAYLSINAGAGGTESCDWAEMLYRMYVRWSEQNGYTVELVDWLSGEEAGVKNMMMMVKGPYAFGYLKTEAGVHRLVRISPFDSNKRRHTSFASVDVIPEVEDIPEIEIKETDLKIDTFRAGGAGGQHVNKTESAVRILHIPTGLLAQCQNERSQFQNRQSAMKILKARIYEKHRREQEAENQSRYGEKKEISWGSQIRSYVFHPYSMVKDLRTDVETSNVQGVMDGDLDDFMKAYLKMAAAGKK